MKNNQFFICLLLSIVATMFTSCKEDEIGPADNKQIEQVTDSLVYIVNYGSYGEANGEISVVDELNFTVNNQQVYAANGKGIGASIQSAIKIGDNIYLAANSGDGVVVLDSALKIQKTIKENITKPRYFVADDQYLYLSCLGDIDSWSNVSNSYIAIIDHTSNEFVSKIPLPNGAQGITIANGKLYVALQSRAKLAVIDLADHSKISYIKTMAVCQQVVLDTDENLWVSQVSTPSHFVGADSVGLLEIDTKADTVLSFSEYSGLGSDGYIVLNKTKTKIFAMGAEPWPSTKSELKVFDLVNKSFVDEPLLEGESFYGIGCSSNSGYIYVGISPGDVDGSVKILDEEGTELSELQVGVSPLSVFVP